MIGPIWWAHGGPVQGRAGQPVALLGSPPVKDVRVIRVGEQDQWQLQDLVNDQWRGQGRVYDQWEEAFGAMVRRKDELARAAQSLPEDTYDDYPSYYD
jgi:hypothetical protein